MTTTQLLIVLSMVGLLAGNSIYMFRTIDEQEQTIAEQAGEIHTLQAELAWSRALYELEMGR